MESPFFHTNSPWSFYYPLPRQRSRLPSVSRGRIYEDSPPNLPNLQHRRQSANPFPSRYYTPSRCHRSSSSASLAQPKPNRGRPSNSRAMQAGGAYRPATGPLRSSPHLWSTHSDTSKPPISFSRAARELSATLEEALCYFKDVYHKFKEETKEVRRYADQRVIDQVWAGKISFNTPERHDADAEHGEGQQGAHGEGENENENETVTARVFRDHQAAVYNSCEDILCALPPPSLQNLRQDLDNSSSGRSLEAAALVSKMARCSDDLFPALRRMGSRYVVVGTAIKEMELLKANLWTYQEVWWDGVVEGTDGMGSGRGVGDCGFDSNGNSEGNL